MKHRPPIRTNGGFTLVEVVVTTFVTLLGLLGIHQLLFYMMYTNAVSAQTTLATSYAQDKMEEMMSSAYDELSSGTDESAPYVRTWTVDSNREGSKDISITVSWTDLRSKQHDITVKSIATDNRLNGNVDMFQNNPIGSK